MGNLAAHVIAGVFISILGLNWIILSIWNHITNKKIIKLTQDHTSVLQQRSWLPFCCFPNFPIEPLFKIILCFFLLLVEEFLDLVEEDGHKKLTTIVYHIHYPDGKLKDQGKLQHIIMNCGFILSGFMDLLTMCLHLPRHTSNTFLSLAFFIEGTLFYFHQIGKGEISIHVHAILVVAIYACLIFSVIRFLSATNLLINLALGTCILLQGTWFIQAGYFLFGGFIEQQKQENGTISSLQEHAMLLFINASFAWEIFVICILTLMVWIIVSFIKKEKIIRMKILKLPQRKPVEECDDLLGRSVGKNRSELTEILELK